MQDRLNSLNKSYLTESQDNLVNENNLSLSISEFGSQLSHNRGGGGGVFLNEENEVNRGKEDHGGGGGRITSGGGDDEDMKLFRKKTLKEAREEALLTVQLRRAPSINKQNAVNAGEWTERIKKHQERILSESLLSIVKLIIFFAFIDVLYITIMLGVEPTACKSFIETNITTDRRGQFFMYWCTSIIHLLSVLYMLNNVAAQNALISMGFGISNLIWHILNIIFYFITPSITQKDESIYRALLYWLESVITFILIDATIVLRLRMKKDKQDESLEINLNDDDNQDKSQPDDESESNAGARDDQEDINVPKEKIMKAKARRKLSVDSLVIENEIEKKMRNKRSDPNNKSYDNSHLENDSSLSELTKNPKNSNKGLTTKHKTKSKKKRKETRDKVNPIAEEDESSEGNSSNSVNSLSSDSDSSSSSSDSGGDNSHNGGKQSHSSSALAPEKDANSRRKRKARKEKGKGKDNMASDDRASNSVSSDDEDSIREERGKGKGKQANDDLDSGISKFGLGDHDDEGKEAERRTIEAGKATNGAEKRAKGAGKVTNEAERMAKGAESRAKGGKRRTKGSKKRAKGAGKKAEESSEEVNSDEESAYDPSIMMGKDMEKKDEAKNRSKSQDFRGNNEGKDHESEMSSASIAAQVMLWNNKVELKKKGKN